MKKVKEKVKKDAKKRKAEENGKNQKIKNTGLPKTKLSMKDCVEETSLDGMGADVIELEYIFDDQRTDDDDDAEGIEVGKSKLFTKPPVDEIKALLSP